MLNKTLTLSDLIFFGITSILGSGGFNLIGDAVAKAGPMFPITLLTSGALFLGSASSYSYANDTYKSNISETKLIESALGSSGKMLSIVSILLYNIFAIASMIVVCSKVLFPNESFFHQISFSLLLLGLMTLLALQKLSISKTIINTLSICIVALLSYISYLGLQKVSSTEALFPKTNMYESFLFFIFVLAGHDALIKFTEETVDQKDVDKSFYISIVISILLTASVSFAAYVYIHDFKKGNLENILADIFTAATGKNGTFITCISLVFMVVTTFIGFLGTTRYIYDLPEYFPSLTFIKDGGKDSVSMLTIVLTSILCGFVLCINHVSSLVEFTDIGLIITLLLVAISSFIEKYKKGDISIIDMATSGGFMGVLGMVVKKHFF